MPAERASSGIVTATVPGRVKKCVSGPGTPAGARSAGSEIESGNRQMFGREPKKPPFLALPTGNNAITNSKHYGVPALIRMYQLRPSAWRKACGTVMLGAAAHRSTTFRTLPSIWLTSMTRIPALAAR